MTGDRPSRADVGARGAGLRTVGPRLLVIVVAIAAGAAVGAPASLAQAASPLSAPAVAPAAAGYSCSC